jgi:hypothetical protein
MKKVMTALSLGIAAGIVDVLPMIIQGLNGYACLSAFVHWMVLGVLIPFVNWNIQPWAKGLIIAELTAVPVMIIVSENEPLSVVPMIILSAVLGALVGWAGNRFVKQ